MHVDGQAHLGGEVPQLAGILVVHVDAAVAVAGERVDHGRRAVERLAAGEELAVGPRAVVQAADVVDVAVVDGEVAGAGLMVRGAAADQPGVDDAAVAPEGHLVAGPVVARVPSRAVVTGGRDVGAAAEGGRDQPAPGSGSRGAGGGQVGATLVALDGRLRQVAEVGGDRSVV